MLGPDYCIDYHNITMQQRWIK